MPSICARYTLESRLRRRVKKQANRFEDERLGANYRWRPEVKHLCSKLLSIGGQEVELTSLPDRDLPILLALGERFTGTAVRVVTQGSSSFRNMSHLWLGRKTPQIAIVTGYALARNSIWYPHAWGIENETILETTEVHIDYFGRYLTGADAMTFAEIHAIIPVSL